MRRKFAPYVKVAKRKAPLYKDTAGCFTQQIREAALTLMQLKFKKRRRDISRDLGPGSDEKEADSSVTSPHVLLTPREERVMYAPRRAPPLCRDTRALGASHSHLYHNDRKNKDVKFHVRRSSAVTIASAECVTTVNPSGSRSLSSFTSSLHLLCAICNSN
ncbi:hypothetical protein J6590_016388 [Homalodisca vitripennis]|nr:hypothetical protein J6590_016388 [Homalodisca vitripennis]